MIEETIVVGTPGDTIIVGTDVGDQFVLGDAQTTGIIEVTAHGIAMPGDKGEKGDMGPAGDSTASLSRIIIQSPPSDTWDHLHGLAFEPNPSWQDTEERPMYPISFERHPGRIVAHWASIVGGKGFYS